MVETVKNFFNRAHGRLASDPGTGELSGERLWVRLCIPLLLIVSFVAAIWVTRDTADVPAVAFDNHVLFAAQLVLLIFYSVLLLLVPLVRALASGELPVELTLKGPRYTEKILSDASSDIQERVKKVEDLATSLDENRLEAGTAAKNAIQENATGIDQLTKQIAEIQASVAKQLEEQKALKRFTAEGVAALNQRIDDDPA
jgi:septal ring factor EnvC (AmiA/AmiB activator)